MQLLFVLLPMCLFWCVVAYKPRCNIMASIYFFEFQTFYSYQLTRFATANLLHLICLSTVADYFIIDHLLLLDIF